MKNNKTIFSFVVILICFALIGLFLILKEKNQVNIPLSSSIELAIDKSGDSSDAVMNNDAIDLTKINLITGLPCDNYNRRPIAVMFPGDSVARPLSGISDADMVFEMQVIEDSMTRLMAVFICNDPKELGSIRSARHDFIPLAMGIDAIYVHWGGSHFALDKLNKKIMNNIDALKNPYSSFFRKSGIAAPHNGFTSLNRLINSARKLNYRLENNFEGYPHETQSARNNKSQTIKIGYTYPFNVEWRYDYEKNTYFRLRGGKSEMDKNNGQQAKAENIVVMRSNSRQIEGQYNDVDVEGEGIAEFYSNSGTAKGKWTKDKSDLKSKLYFLDENGEEFKFVPGSIWVEIIEPEKM